MKKTLSIFMIITMILVLLLLTTDLFSICYKGYSYYLYNQNYTASNDILSESYSFEIDLTDLDESKDQLIYKDGNHRIYIESIEIKNNIYFITFRSRGNFSLFGTGASFVSGIGHLTIDDDYTYGNKSMMTLEYNGTVSNGYFSNALTHKYNHYFTYQFEHHQQNINDPSQVTVTLHELYKNNWVKK